MWSAYSGLLRDFQKHGEYRLYRKIGVVTVQARCEWRMRYFEVNVGFS